MKVVLLTPWISPHQLPVASEIARLVGEENFIYHYLEPSPQNHVLWGWDRLGTEPWCKKGTIDDSRLIDCDVLLSGVRDFALFERREKLGKLTFYMSERWFKPRLGRLRLLHPRYLLMALKLVRLMVRGHRFVYLPIGVHAAGDAIFLLKFLGGLNIRMGKGPFHPCDDVSSLPSFRMWGYFVEPSHIPNGRREDTKSCGQKGDAGPLRVLYVGRLLKLKHVETLILAVKSMKNRFVELTILGDGPELGNLLRLAGAFSRQDMSVTSANWHIQFKASVPVWDVRGIMRGHDVLVFPSDGRDGWGAVVSEALEEGMEVVGTYESGAPATMLPSTHLFHCQDWNRLSQILESISCSKEGFVEAWSARTAAIALMKCSADMISNETISL